MVAVVAPSTHDRWHEPTPRRAPLRLVPPPEWRPVPSLASGPKRARGAASTSASAAVVSASVYRRRQLVALALVVLMIVVAAAAVAPIVRAGVGALGGRPLTPSGAPVTSMQPAAAE